ncbi:MAG: SMC family ATPase, partial [Sphaerobacteraceae bacterium]
MRPVALEMHGFGPYAHSQKLDFRELADRPLFLIHGPTGAGKSSILDAICVALYGQTSGDERKGHQMRSDHAPPDHPTRVVFSFSIGGMIYTIDRTPGQDVPKRDGSGFRAVPQKVSMVEQSSEDDEPRLIASRVNEVGEQVERLLGLRADQFRQVVVLPQGRFRELLTANSNEREKIFSSLFQTHHYRLIQDRLKERAREIRQGLDRLSQEQNLILESNSVESPEALTRQVVEIEEEIGKLTAQHAEQTGVVARARTALEEARTANDKLNQVETARTALTQLTERAEEFDQQRAKLALAQRAATLADAEKFMNDRIAEAETSEKTRDDIEYRLALAVSTLENAEQEAKQADEQKPQLDQLKQKQRDLEGLRPRIAAMAEAEKTLGEASQSATELKTEHEKLESKRSTVAETLEQGQQQLQTARLQAGQISGLEATRNHLSRLV